MMPPDGPQYPIATTDHLVKGEDLNHHHTLYAGRCVECGAYPVRAGSA